MKKIPIKKLDSTFVIEYYCEMCDESIVMYPDLRENIEPRPNIF